MKSKSIRIVINPKNFLFLSDENVTLNVGMIMGISIPLALLIIVIVIILAMFCCCPHLLCCSAANRENHENRGNRENRGNHENHETKDNRRDQLEQESAYTQTKSGYKPFVPKIRRTSPPLSQAEDYAAPIRPPLRRKFYQNRCNFYMVERGCTKKFPAVTSLLGALCQDKNGQPIAV